MADDKILQFPGGGVASPPSPPDPPDMDARLAVVETRMTGIEVRMDGLASRMDKLDTRLDGIDQRLRGVETAIAGVAAQMNLLTTQIVGKLPSWWPMPVVIGSTVSLLVALYAAVRYLQALGLL